LETTKKSYSDEKMPKTIEENQCYKIIEENWCEEDERLIKMLEHIVKAIFCKKTTNIYFLNGWFCTQGHITTKEEERCYNDIRTPIRRWHK
jgi:hypothetical protein